MVAAQARAWLTSTTSSSDWVRSARPRRGTWPPAVTPSSGSSSSSSATAAAPPTTPRGSCGTATTRPRMCGSPARRTTTGPGSRTSRASGSSPWSAVSISSRLTAPSRRSTTWRRCGRWASSSKNSTSRRSAGAGRCSTHPPGHVACSSPAARSSLRREVPPRCNASRRRTAPALLGSTAVTGVEDHGSHLAVETPGASYTCRGVVVCADAWTNQVLARLGVAIPLTVTLEQATYFQPADPRRSRTCRCGSGWTNRPTTGSPATASPRSRPRRTAVGRSSIRTTAPSDPDPEMLDRLASFVGSLLPGSGRPVRSLRCQYTLTPDRDFVLAPVPGHPSVVVGLGAAHGFKFAPTFGRILADLATTGETSSDVVRLRVRPPGTHRSRLPAELDGVTRSAGDRLLPAPLADRLAAEDGLRPDRHVVRRGCDVDGHGRPHRDVDTGPAQLVDGVGVRPLRERARVDGDLAQVELARGPVVRGGVAGVRPRGRRRGPGQDVVVELPADALGRLRGVLRPGAERRLGERAGEQRQRQRRLMDGQRRPARVEPRCWASRRPRSTPAASARVTRNRRTRPARPRRRTPAPGSSGDAGPWTPSR